jgi:hypothetical protein
MRAKHGLDGYTYLDINSGETSLLGWEQQEGHRVDA